MRLMTRRIYDFALAEGDFQLAELIADRVGSAALRSPIGAPTELAERAIERIARRIGLIG